MRFAGIALLLAALGAAGAAMADSRIKDVAILQASRDNQLVGYGLVVGLLGTGDGTRNAPYTEQSVRAMLDNLGIAVAPGAARSRNVAAVIVTASLPAFATIGARIDVGVSSLGDATSLAGGTLVMTPLRGGDGEIYAVAQGPLSVSGFQAQGQAETLTQGVPTSARIANGAIVERETLAGFDEAGAFVLQVRNPDFSTAVAIADAINRRARASWGIVVAEEQDARTILLRKPERVSAARFIAEIENLPVRTDTPARVVMDERTGTVVIGQDVRVSRVAITHGALTVRITEMPEIVQPAPLSLGETASEPSTLIEATQSGGALQPVGGADLQSLVEGLNRLGVKPGDVIAILQAIKTAGALQAELVVQ